MTKIAAVFTLILNQNGIDEETLAVEIDYAADLQALKDEGVFAEH